MSAPVASATIGDEPRFRTIDGLSIRFVESERNATERGDALLLSPWPESVYAFKPAWQRLVQHAHLIAIDLPGLGRSERRVSLMAPRTIGEFVLRAADAFNLELPHVVARDVGKAAALLAAALSPQRLRSPFVGIGGAAAPLQPGGPLKGWEPIEVDKPFAQRRTCPCGMSP